MIVVTGNTLQHACTHLHGASQLAWRGQLVALQWQSKPSLLGIRNVDRAMIVFVFALCFDTNVERAGGGLHLNRVGTRAVPDAQRNVRVTARRGQRRPCKQRPRVHSTLARC